MKTSTKNKSIEWNVFLEAMNNLLIQNEIKKKVITKEKNNNIKLHEHTMVTKQSTYRISVFFFTGCDTGHRSGCWVFW